MRNSLKTDYIDWLDAPNLNVFITVTLKQALPNVNGGWVRISDSDIEKTARLLRDRFTKRIVGTGAYRRRERPDFLVFIEGDGLITRRHLHIIAERPEEINQQEYDAAFRQTASRLEWVYQEIDIRPLTYRRGETEATGALRYAFKNGIDGFNLNASFFRSSG